MNGIRRVRVLVSPRSQSGNPLQQAVNEHWDVPGIDLTYQLSRDARDGQEKARRAIAEGVDTILVVGGDGIVNSIGSVLIGSPVALGVIPAGSGNGFARHFGIPLGIAKAARALLDAERQAIDVGTANGQPFFVTCSMAWDAALVRSLEKYTIRGALPYVLAGASELITYVPQPFEALIDGEERVVFADPLVFTTANLTQYGGGVRIAPSACPDDGLLELVVILRQDSPRLLASLNRIFDGTLDELPGVETRRFRVMHVFRRAPAPIQIDGELVNAPADVTVAVLPKALNVLVPRRRA
jgi:diacylglycerol kinase (ATP)